MAKHFGLRLELEAAIFRRLRDFLREHPESALCLARARGSERIEESIERPDAENLRLRFEMIPPSI